MFIRNKQIIIYGLALALMLISLRWIELHYLFADAQFDVYTGVLAVIFMGLGVWVALKLRKPKIETVVVEKEIYLPDRNDFIINERELKRLNISKRELEVLQLMAAGLSNQEIAERIFVSLNTVKTHSAQIFEKMEVKRRTQAVDKAKKLGLIP